MILIGSKIFDGEKNEYEVIKSLGEGGFGQVLEVKKVSDGTKYALKIAKADGMTQEEFKALVNEGKLATKVKHENVVDVIYFHDGSEHTGLPPYLLMEIANGGSLKEFLVNRNNELLSAEEIISFSKQIIEGISAINKSLVHRDFHPGNILIHDGIIKITDFGLSKVVDAATRTKTFKGIQHIMYKAPESWKMEKNDFKLDMYSLGIVLYELCTLRYPYELPGSKDRFLEYQEAHLFGTFRKPSLINRDLSGHLEEVILKLLKKKPSDRFTSWEKCKELLDKEATKDSLVNVSNLVSKSRATDLKNEQKKIESEKYAREEEEKNNHLKFMIEQLKSDVFPIVEAFNNETTTSQLLIEERDHLNGFTLRSDKNHCGVEFIVNRATPVRSQRMGHFDRVIETEDVVSMDGREVILWGVIKNTNKRGVNIILTRDNEEDMYGTWQILSHEWHAIFTQQDNRPSPFPLERWDELSRQIKLIRAMGKINTTAKIYNQENWMFLLEEVL